MIVTGKVSKSRLTAINYFANCLFSKQLAKHIIVHFQFSKKLECLGLTTIEGYNSKNKPREFIIDINSNQTEEEILKTISHELVHVSQYCTGRLNEKMSIWEGNPMPDDIKYEVQPWEIEAYFLGDLIYLGFIKENEYA
jgi:hypothetical protein